ncbi:MAG: cupredoxin domain-containing protein [Nitrospirales bacterium]|nr:cupredoxin domain-containing protein [Nitrospirales bacterium]
MGRIVLRFVVFLVVVAGHGSCEWGGSESVTITAEEFRFTPARIQVRPDHPFTLIIRNQGRERHVFQSPRLFGENPSYAKSAHSKRVQPGGAIILEAGESIEMRLALGSGLYPFRCWIKGHSGMEGAIVVSD